MIGTLVVIATVTSSLCYENTILVGPRNITRGEGTEDELILCHSFPVQATSFWKISGIVYYYSDLPPPFVVSKSGRDIAIPVVDSTLNGTSFQCFVPSSSGVELISSTVGVLTVTENGNYLPLPSGTNNLQPKMVLIHQKLIFSPTAIKISWRAFHNGRCAYYQLAGSQSCNVNSNTVVLINRTEEKTVILDPQLLSNLTYRYFSLTIYNEEGQLCEEFYLESAPEHVTEDIRLCKSDFSESCSPIPTCIEVPPLNRRQTLTLALPFLPVITGLEEDVLCPVHPLPGERCVDLLSCNCFRKSAYANSITICGRANNDTGLDMCFHNVTDIMNGTRLHFFYSDLHCRPDGSQPESSRTYMKSIQLLISRRICIISKCNRDRYLCEKCIKLSTRDKYGCTTYNQNVSGDSCIPFTVLRLKTNCVPYHVVVEDDNKLIYNGSISGYGICLSLRSAPATAVSQQQVHRVLLLEYVRYLEQLS